MTGPPIPERLRRQLGTAIRRVIVGEGPVVRDLTKPIAGDAGLFGPHSVTWKVHADAAMLILTRKVDQGIVISGNILVRVLGVERDRVKIGISAPGEVTVLRQELWHEGEENQPFEKKERPANGGATPPTAASA